MFINPYQVSFFEDPEIMRVRLPLERLMMQSGLGSQSLGSQSQIVRFPDLKNIRFFGLINGDNVEVPPFGHPLWVSPKLKTPLPTDEDYKAVAEDPTTATPNAEALSLIVDLRSCTSVNRASEDPYKVTAASDFDLARLRGALEYLTVSHGLDLSVACTNFPLIVFTRWLSTAIISRIAVPLTDQVRLNAMIAYFYFCQTNQRLTENSLSEDDEQTLKRQAINAIAKAAMVNALEAEQFIYDIPPMRTAEDFVQVVREYSQGETLRQRFDILFLYNVIGGSFFGVNNKELACIAIEHPITFISLMAVTMKHSSMKRCGIGRAVETVTKSHGETAKMFLRAVADIVRLGDKEL